MIEFECPLLIAPGEALGESAKTRVYALNDQYVLKVPLMETQNARCAVELARQEADDSSRAVPFIPQGIQYLPEHPFVAKGTDGDPTVFKVQQRVHGSTLSDVISDLDHNQRMLLLKLLANELRFLIEKQASMDIVGSQKGDNDISNLLKSFNPLHSSSNIMVDESQTIYFVDVKTPQGQFIRKLIKLGALSVGYICEYLNLKLRKK